MKTLKITLSLAIVILTTSVYSANYITDTDRTIQLKLNTALQNPALVWAMYNQLDESFLHSDNGDVYTVSVTYNNIDFLITGTYNEWVSFLLMEMSVSKNDPLIKN